LGNPSFLAHRQQHLSFDASTSFELPEEVKTAAGLAAFQNQNYWYFLGTRRIGEQIEIFLEKKNGHAIQTIATTMAAVYQRVQLRISGNAGSYSFFYDLGEGWKPLKVDDDGSILSTDVAGGYVGAMVGPYARAE
jgi:xylan 1,4-beta-xylosidase